jgi:DNA-binding response OmpR family regulator
MVGRLVMIGTPSTELSIQQTKVMTALISSPSKMFPSEQLLTVAWAKTCVEKRPRLIRLFIAYARKFEKAGVQDLIEDVRGQGYRLAVSGSASDP